MTPKEAREKEKTLPRCHCGGRLSIHVHTGKQPKGLTHLSVKCKKCGEWHGGFTTKERKD